MPRFLTRRRVSVAVVAVVLVLLVVAPLISSPFINYQLSMIAVFTVALLGQNIIMGYTGQVSLGQSAFLGLGAYVAAYGVKSGWPVVLVFVLSCVLPAVVGMLVAFAAARLRGLALAMVTLALPIVGVPLAKRFPELTGGSQGITVAWLDAPGWSGLAVDQWRYYVVVVIAVVAVFLARNLVRGRVGRAFAIVKSNEAVALSMGISPYRYKVLAFTVASLFGGAAGFLYVAIVQYTSPETMSFATSINLVAAMVIGGSASIVGSILAGAYYILLPLAAGQIDSSRTALISGVAVLAVLFLLPRGIVSLPRRILQAIRRLRRGGKGRTPTRPAGGTSVPDIAAPAPQE